MLVRLRSAYTSQGSAFCPEKREKLSAENCPELLPRTNSQPLHRHYRRPTYISISGIYRRYSGWWALTNNGTRPKWLPSVRSLELPLPNPVDQQEACDASYRGLDLASGYEYESDRVQLT